MTTSTLRRLGVPLAVGVAVLALVLLVVRLGDSPEDGTAAGSGGGAGGGSPASPPADTPTSTEPPPGTPSVVPPEPGPDPGTGADQRMSRFVSVEPGGSATTLDVRFWGGVETCYEYDVRVAEDGRAVELRLVERTRSKGPCIELAQQYVRTVHLQDPLGGRRVADADTGETLLPAAPDVG
jgi:hypothetical protein